MDNGREYDTFSPMSKHVQTQVASHRRDALQSGTRLHWEFRQILIQ